MLHLESLGDVEEEVIAALTEVSAPAGWRGWEGLTEQTVLESSPKEARALPTGTDILLSCFNSGRRSEYHPMKIGFGSWDP